MRISDMKIDKTLFWTIVLSSICLAFFVLFIYALSPIYTALAIALIFVYLLRDMVDRTEERLKGRALSVMVVCVSVFIPFFILSAYVISNVSNEIEKLLLLPQTQNLLDLFGENAASILLQFSQKYHIPLNPSELLSTNLSSLYNLLMDILTFKEFFSNVFVTIYAFFRVLGIIAFQFLLGIAIALFLLFKKNDIKGIFNRMEGEAKDLFSFIDRGIEDIIQGMFLTALLTGFLSFFLYYFFNVPLLFISSLLTGICSMIPVVGAGLVYVPLAFYLLLKSGMGEASLFLLTCYIVISTVPDLFVRPFLSKGRGVGLFSLMIGFICGMAAFGVIGVLLGPIVMVIATGFLKIIILGERLQEKREKETAENRGRRVWTWFKERISGKKKSRQKSLNVQRK